MESLNGLLSAAVGTHQGRTALAHKDGFRTRRWTYDELERDVARTAGYLTRLNVTRGSRVLIWAENGPHWAIAMLALMRIGAVAVPVDVRSDAGFVARLARQVEPVLALLSPRTLKGWDRAVPARAIRSVAEADATPIQPDPGIGGEDLAEIVFTSGTTGAPKGVMLTHDNIASNVASISAIIPSGPSDRVVSFLPLSHMLEQTAGMFLPLTTGASIYYPQSRQSRHLLDAMRAQRPTMLLLVPQALDLLMSEIERKAQEGQFGRAWQPAMTASSRVPMRFRRRIFRAVHDRFGGSVGFIVCGGAKLASELNWKWEALGFPVVEGYGATEASPVIACAPPPRREPGTVGPPLPGVEVKLAPDGEILARGRNVSPGYFRNPSATTAAFSDGWYRTGDLGSLAPDGRNHLRILGRKKDLIVLPDGQNVYPQDVEEALLHVEGIRECAVVGVSNGERQQIRAVVVPVERETFVEDDAMRMANERLAPHQRIHAVAVWPDESFPKTPSLKVKKNEVRHWLESRSPESGLAQPRGRNSGASRDGLLELVADAGSKEIATLSDSSSLELDAGIDSLGMVSLLSAIESELGVYIDESSIDSSTKVADLRDRIRTAAGATRPSFPSWPQWRAAVVLRRAVSVPIRATLGVVAPREVSGADVFEVIRPPLLLASNHCSHLDAILILMALPPDLRRRTVVAAAADYFFEQRLLATTVGLFLNAFPFSRTSAIRPTLEHCGDLMDRGWSILLFPEGTRSTNGKLQPFKTGVGLLGVELMAPVVPVKIRGTFEALPKGRTLPTRSRVNVHFGHPLTFPRGSNYEEAARAVERAVAAL